MLKHRASRVALAGKTSNSCGFLARAGAGRPRFGNAELCELVLSWGASVNAVDDDGWCALHEAGPLLISYHVTECLPAHTRIRTRHSAHCNVCIFVVKQSIS